jgi:hypothetical protein
MRPALRSLLSQDGLKPQEYWPDDPSDFGESFRIMIGAAGGIGEESFDITVCTPSWLGSHELSKGYRWGRGVLVLRRWDPDALEAAVADLINGCEGADWDEIGQNLSRYADWEFANYRPGDIPEH